MKAVSLLWIDNSSIIAEPDDVVLHMHAVADYAVLKYNETRRKEQESVMRGKSNKKKIALIVSTTAMLALCL